MRPRTKQWAPPCSFWIAAWVTWQGDDWSCIHLISDKFIHVYIHIVLYRHCNYTCILYKYIYIYIYTKEIAVYVNRMSDSFQSDLFFNLSARRTSIEAKGNFRRRETWINLAQFCRNWWSFLVESHRNLWPGHGRSPQLYTYCLYIYTHVMYIWIHIYI